MSLTEDLTVFDHDLSSDKPSTDPRAVVKYPYGQDSSRKLSTPSGHQVEYDFLNGHASKVSITLDQDELTKNNELTLRNLRLKQGEDFIPISSFNVFSAKDMVAIRSDIKKSDPQLNMNIDIECPKCTRLEHIPLLMVTDFFYPLEI